MNGSIANVNWASTKIIRTNFFLCILRISNPLKKDYVGFENLLKRAFSREQTVASSRVKKQQLTSGGNIE